MPAVCEKAAVAYWGLHNILRHMRAGRARTQTRTRQHMEAYGQSQFSLRTLCSVFCHLLSLLSFFSILVPHMPSLGAGRGGDRAVGVSPALATALTARQGANVSLGGLSHNNSIYLHFCFFLLFLGTPCLCTLFFSDCLSAYVRRSWGVFEPTGV